MRETAEDVLGVTVEAVDFRELRTDQASLDALKAEIERDPVAFDDDSARDLLHRYLGSSIHVVD